MVSRVGASGGNIVAGVCGSTPSASGLIRNAFACAVKRAAASENFDALALDGVPRKASRADALAGSAVVVVQTGDRLLVAPVIFGAPAVVGLVGDAAAAVIVTSTAFGNINASSGP
jgi:hypothetical protein